MVHLPVFLYHICICAWKGSTNRINIHHLGILFFLCSNVWLFANYFINKRSDHWPQCQNKKSFDNDNNNLMFFFYSSSIFYHGVDIKCESLHFGTDKLFNYNFFPPNNLHKQFFFLRINEVIGSTVGKVRIFLSLFI